MTAQINKRDSAFKKTIKTICDTLENGILSNPSFKGHLVFGPVPSRRLGHSLGINNIKPKTCTYDCVYCQVGQTTCRSTCREICVNPCELFCFVKRQIELSTEQGIRIDYVSFVPSGEPTLDLNLSKEIKLLREFGYKIAVFTNASLLWNDNVKEDLFFADYVSVKVDSVNEATWDMINRPHRRLKFQKILNGIADFSKSYGGVLTTETMLVKNMNDTLEEVGAIGEYLNSLKRRTSYFAIPVRPPAERYAAAPDPHRLSEISSFVRNKIADAEMLCSREENDFEGAGSIEEELLGILSVHPMIEEAIESLIRRKGGSPDTLRNMIGKSLIRPTLFEGKTYYTNDKFA